jgi:fructose-bisphosphate aldolase class II
MGQTYGVPVSEIVEGLKSGVTKVNIDTDLRMASTGSVRRHLQDNPSNFDPRKFLKEATNAMKGICKARYEAFNAAGNASKIGKIYSLDEMAQQYVAGDLDQKIS